MASAAVMAITKWPISGASRSALLPSYRPVLSRSV